MSWRGETKGEAMEQVYMIKLTIVVERSVYEPHLAAHLNYLQELKQRGVLLLSGPFGDRSGGMVLIRAMSHEEAETIARNDPLVSSGVDTYELREWQITDGLPENISIRPIAP